MSTRQQLHSQGSSTYSLSLLGRVVELGLGAEGGWAIARGVQGFFLSLSHLSSSSTPAASSAAKAAPNTGSRSPCTHITPAHPHLLSSHRSTGEQSLSRRRAAGIRNDMIYPHDAGFGSTVSTLLCHSPWVHHQHVQDRFVVVSSLHVNCGQ